MHSQIQIKNTGYMIKMQRENKRSCDGIGGNAFANSKQKNVLYNQVIKLKEASDYEQKQRKSKQY